MLLEKSSVDQHTGLLNKHYIDNYRTDMEAKRIVLLFMDIDDFKSINDIYGHLTGDAIIKSVADCIKDELCNCSKGIRFGGDEFVVIFENVQKDQVYETAERIRKRVNALDFSKLYGDLKVCVSIGLVEGTSSVKELIAEADKAMYNSKSRGKNRTTVFAH